jgi:hypothetical protein
MASVVVIFITSPCVEADRSLLDRWGIWVY